MLKLYENIKRLRTELNMSQSELAKRTGYTDRSSIAKIEKGMVDLSQTKIKQFADVLGVTPGHLMGWDIPEIEKNNDVAVDIVIKLGDDKIFCECVKLLYSMDAEKMATARRLLSCL